jgi:beta-N-acetylhexosaminidase
VPRSLERQLGARILRSFDGESPTAGILAALAAGRATGVGLYRAMNVRSPGQLRALADALQGARPEGDPPVLVAIDQEGGQLQPLGDAATPWPGNLALAAGGSIDLTRRAGEAMGRELAAVGVNVAWAPVCDLLVDGRTVTGTRTFGEDGPTAGAHAAAMVDGLQAAGVAATIKHLPGHGLAAADSHHQLPIVEDSAEVLEAGALVPFRRALRARPGLVMVAHLAVPALVGDRSTPATFAPAITRTLLRSELGFRGVSVTDALNMGALGPESAAPDHAVRAAAAGIDLLLLLHPADLEEAATEALLAAAGDGRLAAADLAGSARRVLALRRWIDRRTAVLPRPGLEVVGGAEHRALADEIARRSITLVRSQGGVVPLAASREVVVLAPRPVDLTPADTSSFLRIALAGELRARGMRADQVEIPLDPSPGDVVALRDAVAGRTVVAGTIDASVHGGQGALVRALAADGVPTVAVALRTPYDLAAYPAVGTYLCCYGIQPPSISALADVLTGRAEPSGRLPVALPGVEGAD